MTSQRILAVLGVSLCAMACSLLPLQAGAQPKDDEPTWFAIMGNLIEADADTVELNLSDLQARGQIKNMDLRVNLAHQRTMDSGEKYTSYLSIIRIDCEAGGVYHLQQTRYVGPRWTGEATTQDFGISRPMAFGGLIPSPKPKVLKAACLP